MTCCNNTISISCMLDTYTSKCHQHFMRTQHAHHATISISCILSTHVTAKPAFHSCPACTPCHHLHFMHARQVHITTPSECHTCTACTSCHHLHFMHFQHADYSANSVSFMPSMHIMSPLAFHVRSACTHHNAIRMLYMLSVHIMPSSAFHACSACTHHNAIRMSYMLIMTLHHAFMPSSPFHAFSARALHRKQHSFMHSMQTFDVICSVSYMLSMHTSQCQSACSASALCDSHYENPHSRYHVCMCAHKACI